MNDPKGVNLYEEHQRFVMSFDPQWRSDENVMLLLSAIALFTPERSNVVHKDVVKFEQVSHLYFSLFPKSARNSHKVAKMAKSRQKFTPGRSNLDLMRMSCHFSRSLPYSLRNAAMWFTKTFLSLNK